MPEPKQFDLVSFRMDRSIWLKFLKLCRSKNLTASQVLRSYINLIATEKIRLMPNEVLDRHIAAQLPPSHSSTLKPKGGTKK